MLIVYILLIIPYCYDKGNREKMSLNHLYTGLLQKFMITMGEKERVTLEKSFEINRRLHSYMVIFYLFFTILRLINSI